MHARFRIAADHETVLRCSEKLIWLLHAHVYCGIRSREPGCSGIGFAVHIDVAV